MNKYMTIINSELIPNANTNRHQTRGSSFLFPLIHILRVKFHLKQVHLVHGLAFNWFYFLNSLIYSIRKQISCCQGSYKTDSFAYPRFYSHIILVPQKTGERRVFFNHFVYLLVHYFRMETNRSIWVAFYLKCGNRSSRICIANGYFYISIDISLRNKPSPSVANSFFFISALLFRWVSRIWLIRESLESYYM